MTGTIFLGGTARRKSSAALGPGLEGLGSRLRSGLSPRERQAKGWRLKRLLRRWGRGGKRARDTPPTPGGRKEEGFHLKPSNTPQVRSI